VPALVRRSARRAPALAVSSVRVIATRMLHHLGLAGAELSVLLTDDTSIHELNRQWRAKDKPTDVLAFPIDERAAREAHERGSGSEGLVLGDVVISLDTAARQARSRKRELFDEVRFLLAHGLLHLIGFDHATREEKREMVALTRRLVRAASAARGAEPAPRTPRHVPRAGARAPKRAPRARNARSR